MTAPRPEGDERLDPKGLEAAAKELCIIHLPDDDDDDFVAQYPCSGCIDDALAAITAYLAAIESVAPRRGGLSGERKI